ncbi:MAG: DUF86 domain-containing protein [Cyanobacteriota bacterium]|nr:DUF86 domain-containing protein [Cyanobacteriota bacterium]
MVRTNIAIAKNKLELIVCYLEKLKELENIAFDDYLSNFKNQLIVERLLELIIKASIDVNEYILSSLNPENIFTKFEAFIELSKLKIISPELAENLSPSSILRNQLIYQYYDIDHKQVFNSISFALQQYPLYVEQINSYLISLSEDND